MLRIVYSCNDDWMDGLYLSILSILRRSKETFEFFCLSADYKEFNPKFKCLSSKNEKILDNLVKSYNSNNFFKVINCTKDAKEKLLLKSNINRGSFSPYSNLRLLINLYPEFGDKILYLDTDTMAYGDVKELFNIDLGDNEIGAARNYYGKIIYRNTFNAGVLLFNIKKCKETKLFENAVKLFNTKHFFMGDQTILYKTATKILYFPGDEYRFNYQKNRLAKDTIIKHFCACPLNWPNNNVKQFQVDKVHKYLKIYEFDEDFKIWQKAKKNWN